MAAQTAEEIQRGRRRKRLVQGLLLGGAAIGLPALANALIRRKAGPLASPRWGRAHRYAWRLGEVTFQLLGEGPPVVLLHSFGPGHCSEEWREVAERLAARYRVHALDFLGWGHSDMPDVPYGGELYADLLADFLEDVVAEPAAVVASGQSAAYGVTVAAEKPEAVRGLALVAPRGLSIHARRPELPDTVVQGLLHVPVLGTSALNLFTSRSNLASHLRDLHAAPERVDAALVERHYRASHQPGAHLGLSAFLGGRLHLDVEALLPRLRVPVWLAWGRHTLYPPVEEADLWLFRLEGETELAIFEHSGALPHAEEPGAFTRALETFLDDAARNGPPTGSG
jgi:pimeloyl-ACP methyl ester carboxylesterase